MSAVSVQTLIEDENEEFSYWSKKALKGPRVSQRGSETWRFCVIMTVAEEVTHDQSHNDIILPLG